MARVVWSPTAVSDLEAIHDFIARDSEPVARAFAERLRRATRHLAEFPLSGRIVPEKGREEIREVIVQRYRVPHV